MPPWSDRLLTKIKKLYVVRLLLPADGRQQPVVRSARIYGFSTATTATHQRQHQQRLSRRRPRRPESSEGVESFSNSQSVPDSCRGDIATASVAAAGCVALSVPSSQQSDESYVSVQRSSSATASTSEVATPQRHRGAARKQRQTPRLRISDSSRATTDATEIAALQQLLGGRQLVFKQKVQLQKPQQPQKLPVQQAELEPEVSVPASYPLLQLPRRSQKAASSRLQPVAAVSAAAAPVAHAAEAAEEEEEEELLVALVLNEASAGKATPKNERACPPLQLRRQLRQRCDISSVSTEDYRTLKRADDDDDDDDASAEAAAAAAAEAVTRTIEFHVARSDEAETEAEAAAPRRRGRGTAPPRARSVSLKLADTVSSSATTAVAPAAGGTTSVSSDSGAPPQKPPATRQRRRQQLRPSLRRTTVEPAERRRRRRQRPTVAAPFEPTFSKIVEWSESTASADL